MTLITVTVWMLLSISDGGYNRGNVDTVGIFANMEECHFVADMLTKASNSNLIARCVQVSKGVYR